MRLICKFAFKVDINGIGFGVMKEYPELVSACGESRSSLSSFFLFF